MDPSISAALQQRLSQSAHVFHLDRTRGNKSVQFVYKGISIYSQILCLSDLVVDCV